MAPPTLTPTTREAARILGLQVRAGRRARRWTLIELADRVGVSEVTLRKVERGDPTVALGTALEAATLVGVVLFHPDPAERDREAERQTLIGRARPPRPARVDDDF